MKSEFLDRDGRGAENGTNRARAPPLTLSHTDAVFLEILLNYLEDLKGVNGMGGIGWRDRAMWRGR